MNPDQLGSALAAANAQDQNQQKMAAMAKAMTGKLHQDIALSIYSSIMVEIVKSDVWTKAEKLTQEADLYGQEIDENELLAANVSYEQAETVAMTALNLADCFLQTVQKRNQKAQEEARKQMAAEAEG